MVKPQSESYEQLDPALQLLVLAANESDIPVTMVHD